jgi:hypothetical protein
MGRVQIRLKSHLQAHLQERLLMIKAPPGRVTSPSCRRWCCLVGPEVGIAGTLMLAIVINLRNLYIGIFVYRNCTLKISQKLHAFLVINSIRNWSPLKFLAQSFNNEPTPDTMNTVVTVQVWWWFACLGFPQRCSPDDESQEPCQNWENQAAEDLRRGLRRLVGAPCARVRVSTKWVQVWVSSKSVTHMTYYVTNIM